MGYAEQLLVNMMVDTQKTSEQEPSSYAVLKSNNISVNGRDRFLSVKFYLGHDEPELEELEKRMPGSRMQC